MRLIDADALIKSVHDEWDECLVWDESGATTADEMERIINDAPTIDPVKHGMWLKYPGEIISDDGLWGETLYDCSNCGRTVHVGTRFCSQCGTKMDEQGEIQVRWKNATN